MPVGATRSLIVLSVIALACAVSSPEPEPPPAAEKARSVWGPLGAGDCASDGFRRYSAELHGADREACQGPFLNVMGARFDRPSGCSGQQGWWDVRDHTCDAELPPLPPRGADGGVAEEAEGYADLHNHLFAHLAFGETVVWGRLWGEPATALAPIPAALRGPHQRIEGFTATRGLTGVFDSHDEHGHPAYTGWPTPHLKTHQQTYVDWMYRAYQGGLRLVVAPAVNNQDMFGRGENPLGGLLNGLMGWVGARATPAPDRTSNDMEALEFQVRAAHEFERWVAANQGGWLAVAETPEEAAELIEAGKLALVLGSEVDHLFNCELGRPCDERSVERNLDRMDALGLAVLFPTHHKVNQFGDAANFQPLGTGPVRACPEMTMDCAAIGLTDQGRHLVREMMARGMLVDLGHAGGKPFDDTMRLLEAENYPTQMTHASAHPLKPNGSAEYTLTFEQLRRIDALDGMVSIHGAGSEYAGSENTGASVPFGCTEGGGAFVQSYLYTRDAMDGGRVGRGGQIGLAPDWNGFAEWPSGRFGEAGCGARTLVDGSALPKAPRLDYPIALPESLKRAAVGGVETLPVMDWQEKVFDFNVVGLAHAGLQPDLLEDMRLHGLSEADLDPFYRSARGFIEMWRYARNATVAGDRGWLRWIPQSATDLIEFEDLATERLVRHAPDRPICRWRGTGQLGSLVDGVCEVIEGDPVPAPLEIGALEIRNANSGLCLEVRRGSKRAGARLAQAICDNTAHQQWRLERESAREPGWQISAEHSGLCLGETDPERGGTAEQQACSGAITQRIALERIGNTFRLRPLASQRCLNVRERSLDAGVPVVLANCPAPGRADFHWEIDGLRDAIDHELLFSTRSLGQILAWRNEASDAFPFAVAARNGLLCRARESLALGASRDGSCVTPSGESSSYQLLFSATPLR